MSNLTINDLHLVLNDLIENKAVLLEPTLSYRIYRTPLIQHYEVIHQAKESQEGRPLAEELKSTDYVHDSTGRAVYYICKGLLQLTNLSDAERAFLVNVKQTFIPRLSLLTQRYEDEAALAIKKTSDLVEMQPQLEQFTIGTNRSLYSLLLEHLDAGKKLDDLLSGRADVTAEEDASKISEFRTVRGSAIATLNRMRQALEDELKADESLPRDLSIKVFAYYDQMISYRRKGGTALTPEEEQTEQTDQTDQSESESQSA